MRIAASIALNDESSVTHSVTHSVRYVGIELLGQLKRDSPSVGGCPRVPARPTSHSPPGTRVQTQSNKRTARNSFEHIL